MKTAARTMFRMQMAESERQRLMTHVAVQFLLRPVSMSMPALKFSTALGRSPDLMISGGEQSAIAISKGSGGR
jgi:hypothetical protein